MIKGNAATSRFPVHLMEHSIDCEAETNTGCWQFAEQEIFSFQSCGMPVMDAAPCSDRLP